MKDILLTILRDRQTTQTQYRIATEKLASYLAIEASAYLKKEQFSIQTPLTSTEGIRFQNDIILVPILRAGLALLYPFLRFYPEARVGFLGMRRDEVTAEPFHYYENLPYFKESDDVMVLEPMIATGGSSVISVDILKKWGVKEEKIIFVSVIAAPEGLERLKKHHPHIKLVVAQVDKSLNKEKFIIPGLGDFGDRYFGTHPFGVGNDPFSTAN